MLNLIFFVCLIIFVALWLFSFISSFIVFYQAKKHEPDFFEKNVKNSLYQNKFTIFWKLMRKKKYSEFKNEWLIKKVKVINIVGKIFIAFFIVTAVLLFYSWTRR